MKVGVGGAMRATGWRAAAIGGKQGDRLTQPPHQGFVQRVHSNERLRVSNWIVQRLNYYAVK